MAENISSSVSRVVMSDLMLAAWHELHLRPWLTVHDSLSYLVDEEQAIVVAKQLLKLAERPPIWWPVGAPPIAAEAKIGRRYGKLDELKDILAKGISGHTTTAESSPSPARDGDGADTADSLSKLEESVT